MSLWPTAEVRTTSRLARRLTSLAALLSLASATIGSASAAAREAATSFKLDNGLEVVVVRDTRVPIVGHSLWYKVGGLDDGPGMSGRAHFLEHMMFKATKTYPKGYLDQTVERAGGLTNATTNFDFTNYYQVLPKERLEEMMAIEADRMVNIEFSDAELDLERGAILQERKMRVDSSPFQRLSERMRAALYPGAPEAMLPIGKESDIRVMTTAAALELYGAAYGPNNAVLVVAGDVTEDAVRTLAEKHYGKLKPLASLPARTPTIKPAPITEVRHQERDPQVTFPGVALYYRVPGMAHADAPALTVLFNALNHLTGALRRELIEKKAIATAVSASFGPQLTHGVFSIAADAAPGVTAEALESALEAVIEEVRRVGVTEERVKSFTDAINASTVFDRDDIIARMDDYGYKVAAGMPIEWIDQSEARFNAVTAADVKRVAETYLAPSNRVVGWLLPAEATAPTASARP